MRTFAASLVKKGSVSGRHSAASSLTKFLFELVEF